MKQSSLTLIDQFDVVLGFTLPQSLQVATNVNLGDESTPSWYEIKAVADFDADGLDDLVVHTVDSYTDVQVLFSNGDGSFTAFTSSDQSFLRHHIRNAVVKDINLDGIADLAGFEASHQMSDQKDIVIFGSSDRLLSAIQPPGNTDVGNHGGAIGDFNLDGRPDLFGLREWGRFDPSWANSDPRKPAIQNELGEFGFSDVSLPYELERYRIADAVSTDLDNDGIDDLILAIQSDTYSRDGAPANFSTIKSYPTGAIIWGSNDRNLQNRDVQYFGDHWMSESDLIRFETSFGPTNSDAVHGGLAVAVMDVTGSSNPEIIINSVWQNSFIQHGAGFEIFQVNQRQVRDITSKTFPNLETQKQTNGMFAYDYYSADINLDGFKDFVIQSKSYSVDPGEGHNSIFIGQSDGSFLPISTGEGRLADALMGGGNIPLEGAIPGDFDGNGATDLAVMIDKNTVISLMNVERGTETASIFGTSRDDIIRISQDATVAALAGDDSVINTNSSLVTASYSGPKQNFRISNTELGINVRDLIGQQGNDELRGITRLQFSDHQLAFDVEASMGQTVKTLAAVLGPDSLSSKQYVGLGLQLFDSGQSLAAVCELALTAVGAATHADVVNLLYTNLFGEAPTEAQAEEYISALDAGVFTKGSLAAAAAELTDDLGVIDLVGLAETGIEYV